MKKTIIISESTFNNIFTNLVLEDKTMDDAVRRLALYQKLGNDYFKNPSISDETMSNDKITYDLALKNQMNEIVDAIYDTYEKISHNMHAFYNSATNEPPATKEKTNIGKFGMHPSTFYLEPDYDKQHLSPSDRKTFMQKCRCYYMLIMEIYNSGVPVWANLFFNPKYDVAKKTFLKCNQISSGTLERISVGVADSDGNYPEGTINWIRKKRSVNNRTGNETKYLTNDFQPATFGQKEQYLKFVPTKEKSAIMQWYIKAKNDPSMYEKYIMQSKPTNPEAPKSVRGKRIFGLKR